MAVATGQITIIDQNDISVGSTVPHKPWIVDMLWLDTSGVKSYLKTWNGLEWVKVNDYDGELDDLEDEIGNKPDREEIYTRVETDAKLNVIHDNINLRVTEKVFSGNKTIMENAIKKAEEDSKTYAEERANAALSAAKDADKKDKDDILKLVGEGKIHKGVIKPDDVLDSLWLDQSVVPFVLKIFDGTEWVDTGTDLEEIRETINNTIITLESQIDLAKDEIGLSVERQIIDVSDNLTEMVRSDLELRDNSLLVNFKKFSDRMDGNDKNLSEINSYFEFDGDGLGIGKSDSPLNINISNDQMDFLDNGKIIAYINGQKMYIDSLEILTGLIIGVHKIEKYNDEITLIKYVGGGK